MRQTAFEVKLIPIDELAPAQYNPRAFDAGRFAVVKESLARLGWLIPAYAADGVLLSGHQRTDAWRELGGTQIPVVEVAGLTENDKRGLNILFNLATNDFSRAELSSQLVGSKPATPFDMEESPYRCMNYGTEDVAELVKQFGISYGEADGWQFTKSMLTKGIVIPIIISKEGTIANGQKRLFAYAKQGITAIPVVHTDLPADFISYYLNKVSMEFDLRKTYSEQLRYGSFRRLRLKRTVLGHGFSAWLHMKQYKRCEDFDHTTTANAIKLQKRFGHCFIDFGAGHLHETEMLRRINIEAIPFEPYHVDGKDEPDLERSREITLAFLATVASGKRFDSVVISSVFNSVPFREDREKILTIVATLAPQVFICSRATKDPQLLNAKGRTNFSENNFGYVNIPANYEENVILGEIISGTPKAQKFYELDELKALVGGFYEDVIGFETKSNVYCHGSMPKAVDPDKLREAIEFEFNLPYPGGRSLGLAAEAQEAWRQRAA